MKLNLSKLNIGRTILCLFIFNFIFAPASQAREVSHLLKFYVVKSQHFEVVYSENDSVIAEIYLNKLEKAYEFLSTQFTEMPKKLTVVINNHTDITNGYATQLPYPHIVSYPTIPSTQDLNFEYKDWPLELLTHELTHIATFYPANGIFHYLRIFTGSITAPNMLLPTWWKEGIAVEMETQLLSHGRSNSTYQDAVLRALILDKKLFNYNLARSNEFLPIWPFGSTPYLFGSILMSHLNQPISDSENTLYKSQLDKLLQKHSRRVPFFIETPAQETYGKSYSELFFDSLNLIKNRAETQFEIIKSKPISVANYLDIKNHPQSSFPSISPDGLKLILFATDTAINKKMVLLKKEINQFPLAFEITKTSQLLDTDSSIMKSYFNSQAEVITSGNITKPVWTMDSNKIYYTKSDNFSSVESSFDIYEYNFTTKKTKQLTFGIRGREISLSLDEKSIYFVKALGLSTQVVKLNLEHLKEEVIINGIPLDRLGQPFEIEPGSLMYSKKDGNSGYEGFYKYDLNTKNSNEYLKELSPVRFQNKFNNNLYFISNKSGVSNLYKVDTHFKSTTPLTNSLTGIISASVYNDTEVWATEMTSIGPRVGLIKQENLNWPPQIEPLLKDKYEKPFQFKQQNSNTIGVENKNEYSALNYLWPHFWIPFFYTSSNSPGLFISAQTFNHDPLKYHYYSLSGSYDTYSKNGAIYGSYENNQWPLIWGLSSQKNSTSFFNYTDEISNKGTELYFRPDLFKVSSSLSGVFKIHKQEINNSNLKYSYWGPELVLAYANTQVSGQQISPEKGFNSYLKLKYNQDLEGFKSYEEVGIGFDYHYSHLLPLHHSITTHFQSNIIPRTVPFNHGFIVQNQKPYLNPLQSGFALRGYEPGQFLARKINQISFDYNFPIKNLYYGNDTDPYFIDRIYGTFILDMMNIEGLGYNSSRKTISRYNLDELFYSAGFETTIDFKIGYFLPIKTVFGFYAPGTNQLDVKPNFQTKLLLGGVF